jgi:hypothetical protein
MAFLNLRRELQCRLLIEESRIPDSNGGYLSVETEDAYRAGP